MASRRSAVRERTPRPTFEATPVAASTPSAPLTLLPSPGAYSASHSIPACIREDMIQQAAYYLAEQRGFEPGHELDDWLTAELRIDNIIRERYS